MIVLLGPVKVIVERIGRLKKGNCHCHGVHTCIMHVMFLLQSRKLARMQKIRMANNMNTTKELFNEVCAIKPVFLLISLCTANSNIEFR